MYENNKQIEYDDDSNGDIFVKLDSYRELLSQSNFTIQDHKRKHGTLLTTATLGYLEENHFLEMLGIDYLLNKENLVRFHQDLYNNILNMNEVLPNPQVINDLFRKKINTLVLSNVLYRRGDDLLCLDIHFDLMLNKYIVVTVDDTTNSLIEEFILEDLVLDNKSLVKEVHHRVKNNIQILLSLMSLQERFHKTELTILKQMKLSLSSMALLHSKLVAEDLSNVSINSIVEDFESKCNSLYSQDEINFDFECNGDIEIEIDKANPILLVINELISQSVENHFENVNNKQISCKLLKLDESIELRYKDNGIKKSSTNDMLLLALISQTDGQSMELESDNYEMSITIPLSTEH